MINEKLSTKYKREHKKDFGHEKIEILYQDQWIIVINKPSGLLSVPYQGSKVRTAFSILEEILRRQGILNSKYKPYIVHRLDRDTSGVIMFALTESSQKKIMNSWHKMVTERLYRAVAENPKNKNLLLPTEGLIDDPLAKNSHNVGFVPKGDDLDKFGHKFKTVAARTNYKIIEAGPTHTLFELALDTGKKNQIRAHLAAHFYPIAGDEEHRSKTDPFHRLCLHARTLEFNHPFTNEHLKFEVPEPKEWLEYVKNGDFHPQKTLWDKSEIKKLKNKNELQLGQKRLTRKDKAHLNFIESGKKYS